MHKTLAVVFLFAVHALGDEEGIIGISLGASRSWHPYAMGANTKFLEDAPFDQKKNNIENLTRLGLRSFRYPGGTAGNDWDWIKGTKGEGRFRFPPQDMAVLHKKADVEVMWMVNMLNKDIDHNLQGLLAAQKAGVPIDLIELGNEFYLKGDDGCHREKYPKGFDYGADALLWIRELRKTFPHARYAFADTMKQVGLSKSQLTKLKEARKNPKGGVDIEDEVSGNWSDQIAAACDEYDVHIIHHYSRAKISKDQQADRSKDKRVTPEEFQSQWEAFHRPNVVDAYIGRGPDYWTELTTDNNLAHDSTIWITEFGVNELIGVMRFTWANAMGVANSIATYINDGRVERFCHANFVGGWVHKGSKDLIIKDLPRMPGDLSTEAGAMTSRGKVNLMYARAMNGATVVQPLVFDPAPMVETGIVRPFDSLLGWRFGQNKKPTRAIILNFSAHSYGVDTTAIGGREATVSQFHSEDPFRLFPRESMFEDRKLGKLTPTLEIPPYSITNISGINDPVPDPAPPRKIIKSMSQDTYVSKADPTSNYSVEPFIVLDGNRGGPCHGIIKFNIREKPQIKISSIRLRVFPHKIKGSIKAYAAKTKLQSNEITWENHDPDGAFISSSTKGPDSSIEFDLSKYVRKVGKYSIVLKSSGSDDEAELFSIESKKPPLLILE